MSQVTNAMGNLCTIFERTITVPVLWLGHVHFTIFRWLIISVYLFQSLMPMKNTMAI